MANFEAIDQVFSSSTNLFFLKSVIVSEMKKKIHGFSYSKNMANFEVFCWNISTSINLFFLKSVIVLAYQIQANQWATTRKNPSIKNRRAKLDSKNRCKALATRPSRNNLITLKKVQKEFLSIKNDERTTYIYRYYKYI